MRIQTRVVAMMLVATLASVYAGLAAAQAYPSKPVRVIVPFAPGGPSDIIARVTAQKLSEAMGQSCTVENRTGAGGTTGTDRVAKPAGDAHTALVLKRPVRITASRPSDAS